MRRAIAHFQFADVRRTTIRLCQSVLIQLVATLIHEYELYSDAENGIIVFIDSKDFL